MEIINYSQDRVSKLEELPLKDILHTESELLYVVEKGEIKVFKKLIENSGEEFSNKSYTVTSLIDNRYRINIDEIVFPEHAVSVSKNVVGFVMPNIRNVTLSKYMKDKRKTLTQKIELLKQINEVLLKMKRVREREKMNFYINDFHEDNILYNKDTERVNFVDIDSCRILQNQPFLAKYLTRESLASYFPKKYIRNETNSSGYIIADQNSDLYCYAIIILNFLYQGRFDQLDITTARLYMEYLKDIGFSDEFVTALSKPFEEDKENEFLGKYLDEITNEKTNETTHSQFLEYVLKKY